MEKREVESKKKRDPCGRREIERVYLPQKRSVTSIVKLPIMKSLASKKKQRKYIV